MTKQGDIIVNHRTGQQMTFLKTGAETEGSLLQIDCYSPVTLLREPEHIHPFQENRFRIISGELTFSVNGQEKTVSAGDSISVPKNVPHRFWNSGKIEARYIQEFAPAMKIDQLFQTFFALSRDSKLNESGIPNIFHASLIMLAHKNEIRLTKPSWTLQKLAFKTLAPFALLFGFRSHYS